MPFNRPFAIAPSHGWLHARISAQTCSTKGPAPRSAELRIKPNRPTSYERYLINSLRRDPGFDAVPVRLVLRSAKNPFGN